MTSALGFKARVDSHLCALLPACNGFLRLTSGATPADPLAASMAAKLFHPCACIQVLMGLSRARIAQSVKRLPDLTL